jgi:hypothetical protein
MGSGGLAQPAIKFITCTECIVWYKDFDTDDLSKVSLSLAELYML